MTNWARVERMAFVTALEEAGPDAPTLCAGWTARDLAAHVVLRERHPDAAIGIVVPALAARTERLRQRLAGTDWGTLLSLVSSGPPRHLRPVDRVMNLVEMHVHCEDVRRGSAGWLPRELDTGLHDALWNHLRLTARLGWRRCPVAVELRTPAGRTTGSRSPAVTIVGSPSELLLVTMGRSAARVDWLGRASDVAAAQASDRSA